jgi:hypothetical protein
MTEAVTTETLKQVQSRVKALQTSRDQIMRQQAVQEQKRDEAYKNLRELGVENPEKMSAKQLQALAEQKKIELSEKVQALEEQLSEGEALVTKFQEMQQEG